MGFPLIPLLLLPVLFLASCLAYRPGKVKGTAIGGGDTQGRLAPQPESPQNWLETLWSSFQSTQLGKEPAWRDHSHSNSHSQSSRWDQVYSGTTGKPHSLWSKPQFFSLAIPPGFSGKGKNCIKHWCCFSFPLSFPVRTFITFNRVFQLFRVLSAPPSPVTLLICFFPIPIPAIYVVLSLTAMCREEPRESWGALGVWGRTATLNTWLSRLACGLAELDTWEGKATGMDKWTSWSFNF